MRKFKLTIPVPFLKEPEYVDVEARLEAAADAWLADGQPVMPWHELFSEGEEPEPSMLRHPIKVIKQRRMAHQVQEEVNFFGEILEDPTLTALWNAHCRAIGYQPSDVTDEASKARREVVAAAEGVLSQADSRGAQYAKDARKLLGIMREQNEFMILCEGQEVS